MEENDKTTDFTKPTGVPFFPNPRRKNWTKAIVERGILKDRSMVSVDIQRAAEDKLVEKGKYDETTCVMPDTPRSTFLMVFSPDGKKVASTHGNHNVYVTDATTGKHIQTLSGHPRTPWCIAFHPSSNQILASGCLGGQVRVWDLQGGSEVWTAESQTVIASLAFHPMDRLLVIATYNELHFWDWSQPEPFAKSSTKTEREKVRYVSFDRLGNKIITGIANPPPVQSQWDRTSSNVPTTTQPPVTTVAVTTAARTTTASTQPATPRRMNWLEPTPAPTERERSMAFCYRNLMNQYNQLVRRYFSLSRSRVIPTTDRGTDPMDFQPPFGLTPGLLRGSDAEVESTSSGSGSEATTPVSSAVDPTGDVVPMWSSRTRNPFVRLTQADSTTPTYSIRRGVVSTRESGRDSTPSREPPVPPVASPTDPARTPTRSVPENSPTSTDTGPYSTGLLRKLLRDILGAVRQQTSETGPNEERESPEAGIARPSSETLRPPTAAQLRPRLIQDPIFRLRFISQLQRVCPPATRAPRPGGLFVLSRHSNSPFQPRVPLRMEGPPVTVPPTETPSIPSQASSFSPARRLPSDQPPATPSTSTTGPPGRFIRYPRSERIAVVNFLRDWRGLCEDLGDLINPRSGMRPNIESSLTMFQNEVQRMQDNNFTLAPLPGPDNPDPPPVDPLFVPILENIANDLADGMALNSSMQTPQPGPSSAPDCLFPLTQMALLRNIVHNVLRTRFEENQASQSYWRSIEERAYAISGMLAPPTEPSTTEPEINLRSPIATGSEDRVWKHLFGGTKIKMNLSEFIRKPSTPQTDRSTTVPSQPPPATPQPGSSSSQSAESTPAVDCTCPSDSVSQSDVSASLPSSSRSPNRNETAQELVQKILRAHIAASDSNIESSENVNAPPAESSTIPESPSGAEAPDSNLPDDMPSTSLPWVGRFTDWRLNLPSLKRKEGSNQPRGPPAKNPRTVEALIADREEDFARRLSAVSLTAETPDLEQFPVTPQERELLEEIEREARHLGLHLSLDWTPTLLTNYRHSIYLFELHNILTRMVSVILTFNNSSAVTVPNTSDRVMDIVRSTVDGLREILETPVAAHNGESSASQSQSAATQPKGDTQPRTETRDEPAVKSDSAASTSASSTSTPVQENQVGSTTSPSWPRSQRYRSFLRNSAMSRRHTDQPEGPLRFTLVCHKRRRMPQGPSRLNSSSASRPRDNRRKAARPVGLPQAASTATNANTTPRDTPRSNFPETSTNSANTSLPTGRSNAPAATAPKSHRRCNVLPLSRVFPYYPRVRPPPRPEVCQLHASSHLCTCPRNPTLRRDTPETPAPSRGVWRRRSETAGDLNLSTFRHFSPVPLPSDETAANSSAPRRPMIRRSAVSRSRPAGSFLSDSRRRSMTSRAYALLVRPWDVTRERGPDDSRMSRLLRLLDRTYAGYNALNSGPDPLMPPMSPPSPQESTPQHMGWQIMGQRGLPRGFRNDIPYSHEVDSPRDYSQDGPRDTLPENTRESRESFQYPLNDILGLHGNDSAAAGASPRSNSRDEPQDSPRSRSPQMEGFSRWRWYRPRFLHPRYHGPNPFEEHEGDINDGMNDNNGPQVPFYRAALFTSNNGSVYAFDPIVITEAPLTPHHRIQAWNFSRHEIPNISKREVNCVVSECKIHNDASVDISADGKLLVTLLPSGRHAVTTMLGVYSLEWGTLGQLLYKTGFDQNAVSVSLSPTARHLLVGLASRPLAIRDRERPHIAHIFRLGGAHTMPPDSWHSGRGVLDLVRAFEQPRDMSLTSLNCIRWAPGPGYGFVYGTNTGQLKILR